MYRVCRRDCVYNALANSKTTDARSRRWTLQSILRHVIFDGSAPALILRVTDHDEGGIDAEAE